MMIFEPPLRGEEKKSGLPVVIMAVSEQNESVLFVDGEGDIYIKPFNEVSVNWRYNFDLGKWVDIDANGNVVPDAPGPMGPAQ